MSKYSVNYSVSRMYQIRGGKLIDGFETEFFLPEFGTTQSVLTPDRKVETIRAAIENAIEEIRKVHALGAE